MGLRYSEAFIEQALIKVYSRSGRTVKSVAEELNVNCHAVKNWMKRKAVSKVTVSATKKKRPQDWNAEQQLAALHETHGLSGEPLHAWCRENGLFAHPTRWVRLPLASRDTTPMSCAQRTLRLLCSPIKSHSFPGNRREWLFIFKEGRKGE